VPFGSAKLGQIPWAGAGRKIFLFAKQKEYFSVRVHAEFGNPDKREGQQGGSLYMRVIVPLGQFWGRGRFLGKFATDASKSSI
jgi:hypothetical protein